LKVGVASSGRGHGDRVEREPITGVWGLCPQRGPGAEPLVGGQGASPPEAESFLVLERPTERQNISRCQLVVFRDMVQVYSQNLVSMVRIGCAV